MNYTNIWIRFELFYLIFLTPKFIKAITMFLVKVKKNKIIILKMMVRTLIN